MTEQVLGPIKIWDNENNQWLSPMGIIFGPEGDICTISAVVPNKDPMKEGWYNIEGTDLEKIAIVGSITHNLHLLPKNEA